MSYYQRTSYEGYDPPAPTQPAFAAELYGDTPTLQPFSPDFVQHSTAFPKHAWPLEVHKPTVMSSPPPPPPPPKIPEIQFHSSPPPPWVPQPHVTNSGHFRSESYNPRPEAVPLSSIYRSRSVGSSKPSIQASDGGSDGNTTFPPSRLNASEIPLKDHLSRAIQLQQQEFAGIRRSRSTAALRPSEKPLPGDPARSDQSSSMSRQEQLRLDEAFAYKLSIQELRLAGMLQAEADVAQDVQTSSQQPSFELNSPQQPPVLNSKNTKNRPFSGPEMSCDSQHLPTLESSEESLGDTEPWPSPRKDSSPALEFSHIENSQLPQDAPDMDITKSLPPAPPLASIPDPPRSRHNSLEVQRTRSERSVTPIAARAECKQCKAERENVSFCPVCARNYCEYHWDLQPLHETTEKNMQGVPHEKTDPELVKRIMTIIAPSVSSEEQVQLHVDDEKTTWFGVQADQSGQLHFHDWGRYEEFLTQSRSIAKKVQFPSLISFVGPTGAGKSTIVKALVKLFEKSTQPEDAQTPVVGLVAHQAVPTSGEVHLYWNNEAISAQRPLLFADCEGLGGGSMPPISEQAVQSKEKKLTKERREKGKSRPRGYSRGSSIDYPSLEHHNQYGKRPFGKSDIRSPPPQHMGSTSIMTPMSSALNPNRMSLTVDYASSPPTSGYSPFSPAAADDDESTGWIAGTAKSERGFTRPITWATDYRRDRQFIVENLYPRLLYTFSDVVVLVMRNAKELESEIKTLIGWAAVALEKSSNQPMLPYAIIVINAVDNHTDEWLLNPNNATDQFLNNLEQAVYRNESFIKWSQFWRERGREIESTKDLIRAFYSGIKIVLIPEKGRPGSVHRQFRVLRETIKIAVDRSEKKRHAARLLLNSTQFNPYLQIAYQHFSQNLDAPFDFIRASQLFTEPTQNTNPIKCLIRSYLTVWPMSTSQNVLDKLSPLIASSIMLDVVRRQLPGNHEHVFPSYEGKLKEALRAFFDESYPCEAVHPRYGGRCIIVKATHATKGHQLASGKVWSGSYQSSQPPDVESAFLKSVKYGSKRMLDETMKQEQSHGLPGAAAEKEIAFTIHRKMVIQKHCGFLRGETQLVNHLICLCCVFKIPIHPLRCGHVICEECFTSAAKGTENDPVLRLYKCPMCHQIWNSGRDFIEVIRKPSTAGIRLLSLDGGGIRAIIELTILKLLEDRTGLGLHIQEFFDLIVGTSGGGIVSLALGEQNYSVRRATKIFKEFARSAFQARRGIDVPIIGKLIKVKYQARYKTEGLESSLRETFGEDLLFGGPRQMQSQSRCRVAVTATDTNGEARLLANYNRMQRTKSLYAFQRFERPEQELKAWEAARATAAAPGFFKGYFKNSNGHTYWDGALRLNNPVFSAHDECHNIWPESSKSLPDVVLSLGTGIFPDVRRNTGEAGPRYGISVIDGVKAFVQIGKDVLDTGMDCERVWQEYAGLPFPDNDFKQSRIHRLNLPIRGPKVELDAVDEMENLERQTVEFYKSTTNPHGLGPTNPSQLLDEIATQLIATLFYFEVQKIFRLSVEGVIKCRLPSSRSAEGSLARVAAVFRRMQPYHRHFRIYPSTSDNRLEWAKISDDLLSDIINKGAAFEVNVEFKLVDPSIPSAIFLLLERPSTKPQMISGFPRLVQPRKDLSPVPSHSSLHTASPPTLSTLNSTNSPNLASADDRSPSPTPSRFMSATPSAEAPLGSAEVSSNSTSGLFQGFQFRNSEEQSASTSSVRSFSIQPPETPFDNQ